MNASAVLSSASSSILPFALLLASTSFSFILDSPAGFLSLELALVLSSTLDALVEEDKRQLIGSKMMMIHTPFLGNEWFTLQFFIIERGRGLIG